MARNAAPSAIGDGISSAQAGVLHEASKTVTPTQNADETVKNRLHVYATQTAPLLEHYRNRSRLVSVAGEGPIDAIRGAVRQVLGR